MILYIVRSHFFKYICIQVALLIYIGAKIRCGTQSILFCEFKIILMINEIVFLMFLQYCNSIKVIYASSQNKTINN